jgi:F-type H+-transporting ATPase subunit b
VGIITLLAAEGGEEASGIELLFPETAELFWGIIAFAAMFYFMWRFAVPQLNSTLEQRQASIQGKLEEAEQIRVEAEELRRQYEQRLSEAENRANEIVEEARTDAERVREQRVAEAEEEAQSIRQRAREDAEAERARLVQQLRGQVATISVDLAGKIVQRELDETRHQNLVDEYIEQLSRMN